MQNLNVEMAILIRIFLYFREGRKSYVDKMLKKKISAINPTAKVARKTIECKKLENASHPLLCDWCTSD